MQVVVARLADGEPRRQSRRPQRLGHPPVPDPGHKALVLEHLAQRATRLGAAKPRHEVSGVGGVGEQVGTKAMHGTMIEAEDRAVPLCRLEPTRPEHEPRATGPSGADRPDLPATAQPQMAPKRDATFEPEQ